VRLLGEVVGVLDRRQHALDREEGGQVGSVRRDDDEGEEPPRTSDDPAWQRPDTVTSDDIARYTGTERAFMN